MLSTPLASLLSIGSGLLVLTAFSTPGNDPAPGPHMAAARASTSIHPRRLLVAPADAIQRNGAVEATLADSGVRTLRELPQIGWRVVELERGSLADAKAALEASGLFRAVVFDHAMRPAHQPNDPYWPGMWHMTQIRADAAWDLERGSSEVTVAVIDTGLDTEHEDLAANVWTNPGEVAGNGVDDDGNGYVDDVHGYDFAYDDPLPDDVYGHGTPCAGIVAALQDNLLGVTGVAPGCRIAGLKAAIDSGYLYDSAVVPALLYAADMGFEVASMSFFGDQVTPALGEAIDYAWDKGLLPIAAAGNYDQALPLYPAAFAECLAVGATGFGDQRSWFSNRGTWVGVAAPGEGVSSPLSGGGYTTGFAGTSAACPHVAGLAALLFSAVPGARPADVRAAIEDSALLLDQPPYGTWTAYGRIDARAALERILGSTSGSVPARLDFVSPCGGGPALVTLGTRAQIPGLHLYGVGLEDPTLRVLRNGLERQLAFQGRQTVRLGTPGNLPGRLELEVRGQIFAAFAWESHDGWLYAPSDASTQGGGGPVAEGGFFELFREDGQNLRCTRRDDALVLLLLALRDVRMTASSDVRLQFTRAYSDAVGAVETIRAYDWSSASYPYGSWITLSTTTIQSTATESLELQVPDPMRFLDVAGTVYAQVETSGVGTSAELRADVFRLVVR